VKGINAPCVEKSEGRSTKSETSPAKAGFKIQNVQTKEFKISDFELVLGGHFARFSDFEFDTAISNSKDLWLLFRGMIVAP
jgi:hypothetical protein